MRNSSDNRERHKKGESPRHCPEFYAATPISMSTDGPEHCSSVLDQLVLIHLKWHPVPLQRWVCCHSLENRMLQCFHRSHSLRGLLGHTGHDQLNQ